MGNVTNSESRFSKILKGQAGQSSVEYILLLVVVVSLGVGVFNSQVFKDFLGEDSKFFEKLAKQMEFSFRHGAVNDDPESDDNFGYNTPSNHKSYMGGGSETRFFIPRATYDN